MQFATGDSEFLEVVHELECPPELVPTPDQARLLTTRTKGQLYYEASKLLRGQGVCKVAVLRELAPDIPGVTTVLGGGAQSPMPERGDAGSRRR